MQSDLEFLQFEREGEGKMINFLALSLAMTTLVTAGVFSPSPIQKQNAEKDDVIVKQGHRVVTVEFEKDDSTKILIAPEDGQRIPDAEGKGVVANVQEKLSGQFEDVKDEANTFRPPKTEETHHRASPRELVCDAFGKCKHKVANFIGRSKDVVSEKVHDMTGKVYEAEEGAREAANEAIGKVKYGAHEESDKDRETKESEENEEGRGKGSMSKKVGELKEGVKEKAGEIKEGVKKKGKEIKEGLGEAVDISKTIRGDVLHNATDKVVDTVGTVTGKRKEVKELAENAAEAADQGAEKVVNEGKKELGEILRRGREVLYDIFEYIVGMDRWALFTGTLLHLLGFAIAYGMCVWMTFASSYVLAGALPRQQFAMVQCKMYEAYFRAMTYSMVASLLGYFISPETKLYSYQSLNLVSSLLLILVNMLYLEPLATKVMFDRLKVEKEEGRGKELPEEANSGNTRVVDAFTDRVAEANRASQGGGSEGTNTEEAPRAMGRRGRPEGAAAKSDLRRLSESLRRLNAYSSALNMISLMCLTWHLVCLGQRIHSVR